MTRELTRAPPGAPLLVLTTFDVYETVFEAVRAGARAYLLKKDLYNDQGHSQ